MDANHGQYERRRLGDLHRRISLVHRFRDRRGRGSFFGIAFLLAASLATSAMADDPVSSTESTAPPAKSDSNDWLPLGLQSYEPSAFGHTKNNDDVGFYNIKISVKYPIAPRFTRDWWGDQDRLYFSFTGVSGFYIGDRHSSPVVGKEFNPQLFWQHSFSCDLDGKFQEAPTYGASSIGASPANPSSSAQASASGESSKSKNLPCYFTIGYNHDSNGQDIDSLNQFLAAQQAQGTEAANDHISRGWDYLAFTAKAVPRSTDNYRVSVYALMKYFLPDGLLQGKEEELHDWERPSDGKPRKEVDGVGFLGKIQFHLSGIECRQPNSKCPIGDGKLAVRYGTGYQDLFKYSTVRIEAGVQVFQLPIVFWTQRGYMSDLSQYYRNVTGYGVEFEIGAF
jgi:hypothetical protein